MIDQEIYANRRSSLGYKWIWVVLFELLYIAGIVGLCIALRSEPLMGLTAIVPFILGQLFLYYLVFKVNRIVLDKTGAAPLPPGDADVIEDMIEGLSIAADILRPRVLLIDEDFRNAFSIGARDASYIFLTQGLINNLDRNELEGLIAHEIAHIKIGDVSSSNVLIDHGLLIPHTLRMLRKRKWLLASTIIACLIPALAVYLVYNDLVHLAAVLLFPLLFGIGMPFMLLDYFIKPEYVYQRRISTDFVADEQAIRWTLNPEDYVNALRKTGMKSKCERYEFLRLVTFAPIKETGSSYEYLIRHKYELRVPTIQERIDNLERVTKSDL